MNIVHSKKKTIMSYVLITLGIFMYTFAWSAFLIPSQIIGGGVSGISSIIFFITGERIPVGITSLVINTLLFLVALKVLGAKFGLNTIYGILVSSGFFILLQQVIGIQNLLDITKFDPFMCAIIGGGLAGAGIGLAFSMGGNSGGTDIIALILNKYYNISPGKVIMYLDIVIIGCSFFVSGSIENVVYGYVQMGVMTYLSSSCRCTRKQRFGYYNRTSMDRTQLCYKLGNRIWSYGLCSRFRNNGYCQYQPIYYNRIDSQHQLRFLCKISMFYYRSQPLHKS